MPSWEMKTMSELPTQRNAVGTGRAFPSGWRPCRPTHDPHSQNQRYKQEMRGE